MKLFAGKVGVGIALAAVLAANATLVTASAETAMTVGGVDVDSAVVNMYIESRLQKPAEQATPEEREVLVSELTDIYLLTVQPRAAELAQDERIQAQLELQKRGLIAQAAATDFLDRNQATDEEVLAEYASQIEMAPPQQFKARHILVETQSAAVDMISMLNDGDDFAELARSNSTGPSGPNGGDLGWFSPSQMVAEFADAVAALENGQYTSEPVQTQFGWHVILREDSRATEPPTLEGVRDVITQRIEQRKLQEYLNQLREMNAE